MTDGRCGSVGPSQHWPIAAASQIRIELSPSTNHGRLFYVATLRRIYIVPLNDGLVDSRKIIIDDCDADIENEPSYVSYVASLSQLLSATTNDLSIASEGGNSFCLDDVIGTTLSLEERSSSSSGGKNRNHDANNEDSRDDDIKFVAAIIVHSYPKSNRGRRVERKLKYILDPKCCIDFRHARLVVDAIRSLTNYYSPTILTNNVTNNIDYVQDTTNNAAATTTTDHPRQNHGKNTGGMRLLIIVNPRSGSGNAKHVYETIVRPMLDCATNNDATIISTYDTLITQRAGHAKDRMRDMRSLPLSPPPPPPGAAINKDNPNINNDDGLKDISNYDGIIALGGDGILFEILQGIHSRPYDANTLLSKLTFGLLACGTFNGLVESLLYWSSGGGDGKKNRGSDHIETMMNICKGRIRTLDVALYHVFPSAAAATTTTTTVHDKNYNGGSNVSKSYLSFLSFAWGLIADCDYESECLRWLGHARSDVWAVWRGVLCRKKYSARFSYLPPSSSLSDERHHEQDRSALTETLLENMTNMNDNESMTTTLPSGWITFDDTEFLVFWVCNTTHAAHNIFTCPVAKMNDGLFHILIVKASCSRLRLILMLLKLDSGSLLESPDLIYIPCVAYRFEPLCPDLSHNVLDGEALENGTIQAHMLPNGARFFCGSSSAR